jgi:AcrR family transcriptional regulator
MFKNVRAVPREGTKGAATRERVLGAALGLFRRRGYERTTMREVAGAAGLALGAAYHYFPSKDALVLAWFDRIQDEHERLAREAPAAGAAADPAARLRTLVRTKLDLLRRDRKLLAALFASLGDPTHPLALFGRRTAGVRRRSIAQFEEAFEGLEPETRTLLGRIAWLGHLALILFFLHDRSPGQARTSRLAEEVLELGAGALALVTHPLAAPVRARLSALVRGFAFEEEGKEDR